MAEKHFHKSLTECDEWIPITDFSDIVKYDYITYAGYGFSNKIIVSGILKNQNPATITIVPIKFGPEIHIPIQSIIEGKGHLFGYTPNLPKLGYILD